MPAPPSNASSHLLLPPEGTAARALVSAQAQGAPRWPMHTSLRPLLGASPTFAVQKPGFCAPGMAAGKPPSLHPQRTGKLQSSPQTEVDFSEKVAGTVLTVSFLSIV